MSRDKTREVLEKETRETLEKMEHQTENTFCIEDLWASKLSSLVGTAGIMIVFRSGHKVVGRVVESKHGVVVLKVVVLKEEDYKTTTMLFSVCDIESIIYPNRE